jgi:hypothetical protein
VPGNARKHARTDLFPVVKSEVEIRPSIALQHAMGAALALRLPPDPFKSSSIPGVPVSMAMRSCRDEQFIQFGHGLPMLEPVGKHAKREHLDIRLGFVPGRSVRDDTRQDGDFGNPAPVLLAFDFYTQHFIDTPDSIDACFIVYEY